MFGLVTIDKVLSDWLEKEKPAMAIAEKETVLYFESLEASKDVADYNITVTSSTIRIEFRKDGQVHQQLVSFQGGRFHKYGVLHPANITKKTLDDAYDRAMKGIA